MNDDEFLIPGFLMVIIIIVCLFCAGLFDGRKQGVEQGKQIILKEAVEKGFAKWVVDQKTGESKVVWCEGVLIIEKDEK